MALSTAALTQFVQAHNTALADHDQWLTRQQNTLEQTNATLVQTNATLEQTNATLAQANNILVATAAQQQINTQEIADLRASLVDLRSLLTDYLRGRSQT